MEPEFRRAARLVVVDQQMRIFLFQHEDTDRTFWATPGGGLEGDETFAEAAAREANEELSLRAEALVPLWQSTVDFRFRGRLIHQVEQYFLLRLPQPDRSTWDVLGDANRCEGIIAGRWWTAEEIGTTLEQVFPVDLRERLADVTEGL
jgi:8-oxo-dGTP pyrophosphatase MutT (NUDIX family)